MKWYQKKRYNVLALFVISFIAMIWHLTRSPQYPELKDGDLIFQTSTSNQASAISFASGSLYTHVGIIKKHGTQIYVAEAIGTTKNTPLDVWINRGLFKRISVYRHKDMTSQKRHALLKGMKQYYGKKYDIFFSFENDTLYCSELPYLLYKQMNMPIGTVQKISELNFDNFLVRGLIEKRWQRYYKCQEAGYNFEKCYDLILDQRLITPVSLSRDPSLEKIYSNYWFW